jgi:ABC-type sugar transport system substrate-binding protein
MTRVRGAVTLFLLNQKNDYQAEIQRGAARAAERQGLALEVHGADSRPDRQREQILSVVRNPARGGTLALLVHPVFDGVHDDLAREAARAGLGWVLLNREAEYVGDLRRAYPRLPIFTVGPDQAEIGRAQGRIIRALLPDGGKVLSITGPEGAASARLRRAGMEEVLQGSRVQIVRIPGDYTSGSGEQAVREWERRAEGSHAVFRSFMPDVVVAQNDAMGEGARRALADVAQRRRWPKLAQAPVVGCDGTAELGQRLVLERTMTATVIVPGTAAMAIDIIGEHEQKGRAPEDRVVLPVSVFPPVESLRPITPGG